MPALVFDLLFLLDNWHIIKRKLKSSVGISLFILKEVQSVLQLHPQSDQCLRYFNKYLKGHYNVTLVITADI